ncbi:drug/metabolite DMT transporter permease [Burkholderia contaminans]|uniref:Drug/metabolite DMT transporter permease n=2 Tax=Burkholderia contaminans TaxID=488447 RepID=A0A3N8RGH3_9BURK|nr:drug/metabolite DMT transporter permease [Burkholderia contaminans]
MLKQAGSMKRKNKATLAGLGAVLLWASVVALVRGVSESLGATGGAAMIYTVASVLLLLTIGFPDLSQFPKKYLVWGGLLFVAYELCLALSIGYASSGQQAIEVAMVNYLWPSFTLVAAIVFNKQRTNLLVVPGVLLSMLGICRVLGGDRGLDPAGMLHNVADNPLSYGLAFFGALIWAGYCTVTARLADGKNGVTPFFMLVALALWIKFAIEGGGGMTFSLHAVFYIVLAASALGFGYAAWNTGIMHGNVTVIVGASYFTPVLAALLAATLLHAPLSIEFWQGALMVCGGSILCWLATRGRRREKVAPVRVGNEAQGNCQG